MARSCATLVVAAAVALVGPRAALAQNATFTFVGETAGDNVSLLLGDADFLFGLGEWRPVVGLQAFVVMDEATDAATMWAVTPSVGVRWAQPTGFVQGKVGFAWTTADDDGRSPFFFGGQSGVTTSLHGEHWGDGRFGLQGIAAHNWGASYLWTRARGTARVMPTTDGSVNLGLEGGWQGHTAGDADRYSATMIGPLAQWATPNVTASLGAGWKNVVADLVEDQSTWYARVELVFSPW